MNTHIRRAVSEIMPDIGEGLSNVYPRELFGEIGGEDLRTRFDYSVPMHVLPDVLVELDLALRLTKEEKQDLRHQMKLEYGRGDAGSKSSRPVPAGRKYQVFFANTQRFQAQSSMAFGSHL